MFSVLVRVRFLYEKEFLQNEIIPNYLLFIKTKTLTFFFTPSSFKKA